MQENNPKKTLLFVEKLEKMYIFSWKFYGNVSIFML